MTTQLYAAAGSPILHSRSPQLFRAAYPDMTEQGRAAYFRLRADSAEEAMAMAAQLPLQGFNATAPLKESVCALAANRSSAAAAANACNFVQWNEHGSCADNFDIEGVIGALKTAGVAIDGMRCLVVGAGGAGAAAALALIGEGGIVSVANRTPKRAQDLAVRLGCTSRGLDGLSEAAAAADIIVNTAPAPVIDGSTLRRGAVLLDAVYPNPTLQQAAMNAGATYIEGTDWLLHQALPSYRKFTGRKPDLDAMQRFLKRHCIQPPRISLIGFAGSGKSTTAAVAAKLLGFSLIGIDKEIEKRYRMPVHQLITERGEAYFRQAEYDAIADAIVNPMLSVIDCGGGAVALPEVRRALYANSIAFWLHAPLQQCLQNIGSGEGRPLLHKEGTTLIQQASALYKQRLPLYAQTAWVCLNAAGKTADDLASIIYAETHTARLY